MAHLFKPHVTRYRLPDGQAVRKQTPGARKVRERPKKWYGQFTDPDELVHRVALCTDKAAAQGMLAERVRKAQHEHVNPAAKYEQHVKGPLSEHLAAFRHHLEAKGGTDKHIRIACARLQLLAIACRFTRLVELSASRVAGWLAEQRAAGRYKVGKRWVSFGKKTSNYYLSAVKQFGTWLVRDHRLPENPFVHLASVNAKTDVRRERRTLESAEFELLVAAARAGMPFRGLSGADRELLSSWPPILGCGRVNWPA